MRPKWKYDQNVETISAAFFKSNSNLRCKRASPEILAFEKLFFKYLFYGILHIHNTSFMGGWVIFSQNQTKCILANIVSNIGFTRQSGCLTPSYLIA